MFLYWKRFYICRAFVKPPSVCRRDLLTVHSMKYLMLLTSAFKISAVIEIPVCILPQPLLFFRALKPFLYQTGGTILGVGLAFHYGWSINIGGGFHHAHSQVNIFLYLFI